MSVVAKRPKPRLYRIARTLRLSGILALVLVLVYIAYAVDSIATHPPQITFPSSSSSGGNSTGCASTVSGSVSGGTARCMVNVTNRASLPLGVQIGYRMAEVHGPLLAAANTPMTLIGPGQSAQISLVLKIYSQPTPGSNYTEGIWLNASYAYLFTLYVELDMGGSFPSGNVTGPPAHANVERGLPTAVSSGVEVHGDRDSFTPAGIPTLPYRPFLLFLGRPWGLIHG